MPSETSQITVGLDVGYEAVRLVAIEHTPDGPVLHRVGAQPLPAPRTPAALFENAADVTAAIRTVFASYGDPAWPVVGGLRNRFATVLLSQVDQSADAQTQYDWLMWEAAHAVIDPLDQYVVDAALTGRESEATREALIVAAREPAVDALFHLLQDAGLAPAALSVATIALLNAFEVAYRSEPGHKTALVHIEPGAIDVIFVRGTVSYVAALSLDADGAPLASTWTDGALTAFGSQLQALLNTFPHEEVPTRVIVSGEMSGLPEVCARWADILSRPVVPASPFRGMRAVPDLEATLQAGDWAPFMVAAGLALKQPG